MARCLIALGANLGDADAALRTALQQLQQHPQICHLVASRLYRTAPVGGPPGQPEFWNAAACFETDLTPEQLLDALQGIENALGRQRHETWGPRTLDLDLLLYDKKQLASSRLTLPHPRMTFRRFVLEPAAEIAGEMLHPTSRLTLSQLLMHVNSAPRYVALAGSCWFAKQYVTQSVTAALREAGLPVHAPTSRGMTVLGAPPVEDPEHSFVEHYVELLPRLAKDLREPLEQSPQSWLISSYWPGELKLGARLWFSGQAREIALAAYEEAFAGFPSPKLLVLMSTPDHWLLFDPGEPDHPPAWYEQAQRQAHERDALEALIRETAGLPLLRLSADQPEPAIRELHAAVLAMTK